MESNGKQVNRRGEAVRYATGPVIRRARHEQPAFILPAPPSGNGHRSAAVHRFQESQAGADVVVEAQRARRNLRES